MKLLRILFAVAALAGAFSVSATPAHAQSLLAYQCFSLSGGNSCYDFDFGFSVSAGEAVVGECFGGVLEIDAFGRAVGRCLVVPVFADAQASGGDEEFLDDCGIPYFLGQVGVVVRIIGPTGQMWSGVAFMDCAGGQSEPIPPFGGPC